MPNQAEFGAYSLSTYTDLWYSPAARSPRFLRRGGKLHQYRPIGHIVVIYKRALFSDVFLRRKQSINTMYLFLICYGLCSCIAIFLVSACVLRLFTSKYHCLLPPKIRGSGSSHFCIGRETVTSQNVSRHLLFNGHPAIFQPLFTWSTFWAWMVFFRSSLPLTHTHLLYNRELPSTPTHTLIPPATEHYCKCHA